MDLKTIHSIFFFFLFLLGQNSPVDYQIDEAFPSDGPQRIFKVFSENFLSQAQLDDLFSERKDVKTVIFFFA